MGKREIRIYDDPEQPVTQEQMAALRPFWDRASGDDVTAIHFQVGHLQDPTKYWLEARPEAKYTAVCRGPVLAWQCPICQIFANEWARYYRAALARMEEM